MGKRLSDLYVRVSKILKLVALFSFILLSWLISFYYASAGLAALPKIKDSADLATILTSTGTIALFIFSMLIAAVAIVGWQTFEGKVKEKVEAVTAERLETTEKEARGRSFAILGYVIGENSLDPERWRPTNVERLKEAIHHCRQGYNFLKGTNLPVEFMALNNLLGYTCALGESALEKNESPRTVVKDAYRLKAAAEEHDEAPGAASLLLTYARAILVFSKKEEEMVEAAEIVREMNRFSDLDPKQRRDAEQLARLFEKRPPAGL